MTAFSAGLKTGNKNFSRRNIHVQTQLISIWLKKELFPRIRKFDFKVFLTNIVRLINLIILAVLRFYLFLLIYTNCESSSCSEELQDTELVHFIAEWIYGRFDNLSWYSLVQIANTSKISPQVYLFSTRLIWDFCTRKTY